MSDYGKEVKLTFEKEGMILTSEVDTRYAMKPGLYIPGQSEPILDGSPPFLNTSAISNFPLSSGQCNPDGPKPGVDAPHFVTGLTATQPEKGVIEQKIIPSTGTKLVCTQCGTQDWHVLMLRRKAGLIEGLCKQEDGSGCYPLATRRNCSYTYPNQIDCPQVAEYCLALGKQKLYPRQVCRDHVGEMLRQGPLYQIWPLED